MNILGEPLFYLSRGLIGNNPFTKHILVAHSYESAHVIGRMRAHRKWKNDTSGFKSRVTSSLRLRALYLHRCVSEPRGSSKGHKRERGPCRTVVHIPAAARVGP